MTCGRAVALAFVSYALLAASVVAATDAESPTLEPVIPPGQEALIAGMLGRGMALPDCTLVSCGVDHTVIEATYDCVDGDVTLRDELDVPQVEATIERAATALRSQWPEIRYVYLTPVPRHRPRRYSSRSASLPAPAEE